MLLQHLINGSMLLQNQELIHIPEGHEFVIVFVFGCAHVITVLLATFASRFGHHADGISGVTTLVLPAEEVVLFGVVN